MKVLLCNFPWHRQPNDEKPGTRGVRAGSRWPHVFDYYSHRVTDNIVSDLILGYTPFPFWLATAGALLKKNGIDSYVRDSIALGETYDSFFSFFQKYNPQILFVETATATLEHDLDLIEQCKIRQQKLIVVVGGLHNELASPEFLMKHANVDFVIYGEYEVPLLNLLKTLVSGKNQFEHVKNLVFREDQQCKNTDEGNLVALDELPWPERGQGLPAANYFDGLGGLEAPQLQIMSSRGCPYGCIFCVWPQLFVRSRKYRTRSASDVVSEIEANFARFPYKSFYIDDDTFNINKSHVLEIAKEIKKRNLNRIRWGTMGRADLMDIEQLEALQEAGLFAIKYGVESADQANLDESGKSMILEKAIEGIIKTAEAGIKVHATFTFGLPNDSKETIEATIALAKQLPLDTAQFSIATPYPGTKMYEIYKQNGWLLSENWADYVGSTTSVHRTDSLGPRDLEHYIKVAKKEFEDSHFIRELDTTNFLDRLRDRAARLLPNEGAIIVLQCARVNFTSYLARQLLAWGYHVHVFLHERFLGSFQDDIPLTHLHTFRDPSSFVFEQLRQHAQSLYQKYQFQAAVVPYSNSTGAGYGDVEKIAGLLAREKGLRVNLKGEFLD